MAISNQESLSKHLIKHGDRNEPKPWPPFPLNKRPSLRSTKSLLLDEGTVSWLDERIIGYWEWLAKESCYGKPILDQDKYRSTKGPERKICI